MRKFVFLALLFVSPMVQAAYGESSNDRTASTFARAEGDCERMTDQVRVQGRLGGIEERRILELLAPLKVGRTATGEEVFCVRHFLQTCPRVLESFYFRNGYPETKVEIEVSAADGSNPFLLVQITASKGCEVGEVWVQSDGGVGAGVIAACMPTGETFSVKENPQTRFEPRIRAVLKEVGVANPDIVIFPISYGVTPDDRLRKNFLIFIEKEKSDVLIADVQFVGSKRIRTEVLRSDVVIAPGERVRPSMIAYSLKALRSLGFFSEVKVEILPDQHSRGAKVIVFTFKDLENLQPISSGIGSQP